jgi:hypothetical protein
MCNTQAFDVTSRNVDRRTDPFCDNIECIEPCCPMVSDSTGCTCCHLVGFLEVEGAKPCMRDQSTSGAHGLHRLRCHTFPPHLRAEVPHIFLTALLTSVPVGFPYGPRERHAHCEKLAISSPTKFDTLRNRGVPEVTIGLPWKQSGHNAARLCAHFWLCYGVMAWRGSAPQPVLTRDRW